MLEIKAIKEISNGKVQLRMEYECTNPTCGNIKIKIIHLDE